MQAIYILPSYNNRRLSDSLLYKTGATNMEFPLLQNFKDK